MGSACVHMGRSYDVTFRCWEFDGLPDRVEFGLDVVAKISAAARDGFMRFPHGGVEVGGILLGERHGWIIRVTDALPVSIEYANGARFVLSQADGAALQRLVDRTGASNVTGWYSSHTRRDVTLSETDLDMYDRHFADPGSICLVVKPALRDVEAMALYFRANDGTIVTSTAFEDREIELATAAGADSSATVVTVPEPLREEPVISAPDPSPDLQSISAPEYSHHEPERTPLPGFLAAAPAEPVRRRSWMRYAAAAVVLIGGASGAWLYHGRTPHVQAVSAPLNATPDSGNRNRATPVVESVPPSAAVAAPEKTVAPKRSSASKHSRHRRTRSRRRG
jgi:proteasome lid subunit RPN8/RPN11